MKWRFPDSESTLPDVSSRLSPPFCQVLRSCARITGRSCLAGIIAGGGGQVYIGCRSKPQGKPIFECPWRIRDEETTLVWTADCAGRFRSSHSTECLRRHVEVLSQRHAICQEARRFFAARRGVLLQDLRATD